MNKFNLIESLTAVYYTNHDDSSCHNVKILMFFLEFLGTSSWEFVTEFFSYDQFAHKNNSLLGWVEVELEGMSNFQVLNPKFPHIS